MFNHAGIKLSKSGQKQSLKLTAIPFAALTLLEQIGIASFVQEVIYINQIKLHQSDTIAAGTLMLKDYRAYLEATDSDNNIATFYQLLTEELVTQYKSRYQQSPRR